LGILDLDIMNKALLAKWIFRFKDNKVTWYWKKIITFKYARVRNRAHFSPFWKSFSEDLDLVEFYINKVVGNGHDTLFWIDRWRGSFSLAYDFSHLFYVCKYLYITVAKVFCKGVNNLEFNSNLSISLKANFAAMVNPMINVQLDNQVVDQIKWRWNETDFFTVYFFILDCLMGVFLALIMRLCGNLIFLSKYRFSCGWLGKIRLSLGLICKKKDGKDVLHVYFVIRRKMQTISLCNVHMLTVFGNG
jgi:hypothetical protein